MSMSVDKGIRYLVSLDQDDPTIEEYIGLIKHIPNVHYVVGVSRNKIDAVNRDMELERDWDILLLASDDMIPEKNGWDKTITEAMEQSFPDMDGVLHFDDGFQHERLCTLCVIGKKYYDRFGYIYCPEYSNLWCDFEFTEVAYMLGKYRYLGDGNVVIRHEHPLLGFGAEDALYKKNNSYRNWKADGKIFVKRRHKSYYLPQAEIKNKYMYSKAILQTFSYYDLTRPEWVIKLRRRIKYRMGAMRVKHSKKKQ